MSPDEIASIAALGTAVPRFNIAPTQMLFGIHPPMNRGNLSRQCSPFRWGLIPSWASDASGSRPLINARSETVEQKKSFCDSFRKRRCLIPADGYYEWQASPDGKQPYFIEPSGGGVLAMAGLWAENNRLSPGDRPLQSCTVLTTIANKDTQSIHDRMPVFLTRQQQEVWLDPDASVETLKQLLRPAPDGMLITQKVSSFVNSVRNDDARCIEPYEPPTQMSLF